MLLSWAVASAVLVVSLYKLGSTGPRRLAGFLLGVVVSSWMITFYPMAETFWSVVGTPP